MPDPIKPDASIWNILSQDYTEDIAPFELALSREVHRILESVGIPADGSLLEVGCGSGHLSLALARAGHKVTLVDFAEEALRASRASFEKYGQSAEFVHGDLLELDGAVQPGAHDVVWNSGVLEHFDDATLKRALGAMWRAARRLVVFIVPNADSFLYQLYRLQMLRDGRWNVGVEFLRRDYAELARSVGFERVRAVPCGQDFTETFMHVALRDPEVVDAAKTLLEADGFFADQLVLQCYVCPVDEALELPAPVPTPEHPAALIDRTFYLDALGAANAATTAYRQMAERERVHGESTRRERDDLSKELDDTRAEVESQVEALEEARALLEQAERQKIEIKSSMDTQLTDAAVRLEKVSQEAAWAHHSAQQVEECAAAIEHARGMIDEASRSLLGRFYRFSTITARARSREGFRGMFRALGGLMSYVRGNAQAFERRIADDPLLRMVTPIGSALEGLRTISPPTSDEARPDSVGAQLSVIARTRLRRHARRGGAAGTTTKRVAYFTNQLLDWYDRRPRYGGGERYCLSLTRHLEELGFQVDLFQIGKDDFEGDYHGHKVQAIPMGTAESEFILGAADTFYERSVDHDHVIYNLPELCAGRMRTDALAICHGIWFDHGFWPRAHGTRSPRWFANLRRVFSNPARFVSVDTASINVVRSLWPDLAGRMTYIPNFVDTETFVAPKDRNDRSKPVVLIPRRSHANRGSRLLARLLDRLPQDADIYWVGEGDAPDTELIRDLCRRDRRLSFDVADFDEMPAWYARADIAVIPTVAAEGTSLSCLEAMACGCAVVSTHVGGLANIVQDEVNGLLVDPNADALAAAIGRLIDDDALRQKLAAAGLATADAFSAERWKSRWTRFLEDAGWLPGQAARKRLASFARTPGEDPARVAIVTRNASHGGVESIVRMEAIGLGASVLVAGGLRDATHTCPFAFEYFGSYEELKERLADFDAVLYHWPFDWAVRAIRDSGLPSVEFVHRTDTCECDKSVPTRILTTSDDVVQALRADFDREAKSVPQIVDLERFHPQPSHDRSAVGGITSYTRIKGVDVVLRAWALLPDDLRRRCLRFYGTGDDRAELAQLAGELGIEVDLRPSVRRPEEHIGEFHLCVSGARQEGLPVAILEALAAGVPVVHSDIFAAREINRRAEELGCKAPLLLFASEDHEDLARVLQSALRGDRPSAEEVRAFVERAYATELHVAAVRGAIAQARAEGPRGIALDWQMIDEVADQGSIHQEGEAAGFLLDDSALHAARSAPTVVGETGALAWTAEQPLRFRYQPPDDADRVSIRVEGHTDRTAGVHLQLQWRDAEGQATSVVESTYYIDTGTPSIYGTADRDAAQARVLDVTMTPAAGATFFSSVVQARAWARKRQES